MATPRKAPPKKKLGQGKGPRAINGMGPGCPGGSGLCGWSEKHSRAMVARGLMPHRRLGGRIIFIKAELEKWLLTLGGVNLEEATENMRMRNGE